MKEEQRIELLYDRLNTRYNRLWEQITKVGIFVLASITAYLITLTTIENGINSLITLEKVNYVLLGMSVITGIISALFCAYLVFTRKELTELFQKIKFI